VDFQALAVGRRLFQPSIQSFREGSVFIAGLFNCTTAAPILACELDAQANVGLAAFCQPSNSDRLLLI